MISGDSCFEMAWKRRKDPEKRRGVDLLETTPQITKGSTRGWSHVDLEVPYHIVTICQEENLKKILPGARP